MNLTLTLQKMTQEVTKFKDHLHEFWKMVFLSCLFSQNFTKIDQKFKSDFSFFWNRFFSLPFFLTELNGYILPVTRGHFHQFSVEISKRKLPRRNLNKLNNLNNLTNSLARSAVSTNPEIFEKEDPNLQNLVVNDLQGDDSDFREVEELFDASLDTENAEKVFQNVILGNNSPKSSKTKGANLNQASFIDLGMMARIACDRFGPRYLSRGADFKGNVSNFVETEQFVFGFFSLFSN